MDADFKRKVTSTTVSLSGQAVAISVPQNLRGRQYSASLMSHPAGVSSETRRRQLLNHIYTRALYKDAHDDEMYYHIM